MTELSTSLLEKFVTAEDKTEVLKEVTPHSPIYAFIELIIGLSDPSHSPAALEKAVKDFWGTRAKSEHKELVKLRLLLNQLNAAKGKPEEVKRLAGELNRQYLNYSFEAVNPFQTEFRNDLHQAEGATPSNALSDADRKSLTLEEALEKVYKEFSLGHLNQEFLEKVDLKRLDFTRNYDLVTEVLQQTTRLNDAPNLLGTLQELMKQSRGVDFVERTVWPKLSLANKEALLTKDSPLGHKTELWMDLAKVKFDLEGLEALKADPAALIKVLEQVSEFLKKMPARFVQFRRAINLQILEEKVRQGTADKKALIEYLKDPVAADVGIFKERYCNGLRDQREKNKEDQSCPPTGGQSEGTTVRQALVQILRDASDYKDFEDYLDPRVVAKIFYEQKLLKGEDAGAAKDFLSEAELQKLFNERRLRFLEANQRRFGKGEKVQIGLEVKNVPRLTVRLFEVNTLNYLLEKNNLSFELIDTAGLIPSAEQEYRYSHNAMVVHRELFDFHNIQTTDQGVFILDFIGGEVKARAVVIKGQLNLVYDKNGGRTAVLLDQDGQVCRGDRTGLYIKGAFFPAKGDHGEISVPSTVAASEWQAIAVHGGFATLCSLRLQEPNPSLRMNVLYNSETFQPGNTVSFVIEPKLELFGRTADPAQLRKVTATVTTTNEQGVTNNTNFPNLKLRKGEDLTVSIIFPPRVRSVTIDLSAEHGVGDNKKTLRVTKTLSILVDSQENVQSVLFQKQTGGSLRVGVVGRNGEPRRNQVVNLKVGLKFLREAKSLSLVTNDQGVVELSSIKDLDFVEAASGSAFGYYRPTEEVQVAYPDSIDLKEDEPVTFPFNAEFDTVYLSKVRGSALVEDLTKTGLKRSANALTVQPLKEGTYLLEVNKNQTTLRVHKGEYIDGKRLLKNKDAIIALPGDQASWFQSKRDANDSWEVRFWAKNPDVKVRLLTFNYLPNELKDLLEDTQGWQGAERQLLSDSLSYAVRAPDNVYSQQIFLGDEISYVYARRSKKSFIGNTLEKPGVLLKRNRLGETEEVEQVARAGESDRMQEQKSLRLGGYQQQAMNRGYMAKDMAYYRNNEMVYQQAMVMDDAFASGRNNIGKIAVKEYLANPGKLVTGLKPENGLLRIPKDMTAAYPFSFLSVSDGSFSAIIPLESDTRKAEPKDITLAKSRKEGFIYAYGRDIKLAAAGHASVIPNVQNTQLYMITSLKEFWDALLTLSPHLKTAAEEWDFLTVWGNLDPMEKLKKYDKYASHELNLFVALKDPEFFDGVVLPHLRNKREKGIVDFFLLNDAAGVADKLKLAASNNLPLIERILLAALAKTKAPEYGEALLTYARSYLAVNKLSTEERKRRFETLMNVNSESHATFKAEEVHADDGPTMAVVGAMQSFSNMAPPPPAAPGFGGMRFMASACPPVARRMMAKKECARVKPMKKMKARGSCEEECDEAADLFGGDEGSEEQEEEQEIFKPTQKTVEYNERQYFEAPSPYKNPTDFLASLLQHLLRNPNAKGFVSTDFLSGIDNLNDLLTALAFTALPFDKTVVASNVKGNTLTLSAPADYLLLVKEVIEKPGDRADLEVQCSQKIYDPADPVIYDDEDPEVFYDKPVEEFLTGRPYASRVVITNSTTTQVKLTLILEVPEGSIPLDSADVLRIRDLTIQPFNSEVVEFRFYFPKVGAFGLFPATVVKGDRIVASAKRIGPIDVRAEKSAKGLKTISDVLANGNIADIIEFMKSKNLLNPNVFSLSQVYWLLKNRDFYSQAIALCEEKGLYDETLWSYSIFHGDFDRLSELLQSRADAGNLFPNLTYYAGDLLRVDRFRVREYYPLINPRAHVLGNSATNIVNTTFKRTYEEFLAYLFQKFTPSADDYVLLVNYLIAQDQIERALELTNRLAGREAQVRNHIQFEYQTAYLNFITGYPDFARAKAICERYLTYPVLSWRNLFVEMANQLAEFEEADTIYKIEQKLEGEQLNKKKAAKAASFSASLEGKTIKLVSCQVGEVTLRFYKVELEVVFSVKPFEFQAQKEFTFVAPFLSLTVPTNDSEDISVQHVELPANVTAENLFIEARASNEKLRKSEYLTYLPFGLNCVVTKEFGILKVFEPASNKPVPRVYVKCFAKFNDGTIRFYKDGYTDIRGSFDYVSLNTDRVDNIKSFAILVTSPEHGAKVITEDPPAKIGTDEGQAKKLISAGWEQRREQNVTQQKLANVNKYQYLY